MEFGNHASSTETKVLEFPAGLPAPHLARDWARSVEAKLSEDGLTDVAREQLPPGRFAKLWSDDALEPPPDLPRGAGFGDQLKWRQLRDLVEQRRSHNEQVLEQRCEMRYYEAPRHCRTGVGIHPPGGLQPDSLHASTRGPRRAGSALLTLGLHPTPRSSSKEAPVHDETQ